MQLRLDAADRLVELVEERRGPVVADEAARRLFALRQAPVALARSLLAEVVEADARLAWNGDAVSLARPPGDGLALEDATYVVVDLETTGLRPGASQICEIGAVRVRGLELAEEFQTLVDPGMPMAAAAAALTGLRDTQLRAAPPPALAVRRFLEFAGSDAVLVAHNARFDLAFLDRETERLTGSRIAAPVVDTVPLARRLLAGRVPRASLAQLSYFLGTANQPCHRALPDAMATAEVLLALIGLAQERGARTVADLVSLGATRTRRVWDKRHLAFGAPAASRRLPVPRPERPGALRRARPRPPRPSPLVLPLGAAAAGGGGGGRGGGADRVAGARLRARGGARGAAADPRAAAAGERARCAARPVRLAAPARRRSRRVVAAVARRADRLPAAGAARRESARARTSSSGPRRRCRGFDGGWPSWRTPAATRTRRGCATGSRRSSASAASSTGSRGSARVERCLVVPAAEPGHARAFFVAGGRVAAVRTLPPGGGHLEIQAGLAAARHVPGSDPGTCLDELLLVGTFLRKPPPELRVVPLELDGHPPCRRAGARLQRTRPGVRHHGTRPQETGLF